MTGAARHDFELSDPSRLVAEPEVSVGIITYNHEPYLAQAIESVLEQRTRFSFEIVIYEDCSTDGTRAIAFDFQRRHPDKIRVLYSANNVGMGENVRRGIAAMRGRYTAGCDGDDFWNDPTKLQRQHDALEANPGIDMCFSRGLLLSPDGAVRKHWDYGRDDRVVQLNELLRTPGMVAPTASLFFRTQVLQDSPDWIYAAPVIDIFHTVAGSYPNGAYYLAADTVTYRTMAAGSWSRHQDENYHAVKLDHSRRMIESYNRAAESFGLPLRYLKGPLSLPHYLLGREALAKRDYGQALRYFARVHRQFVMLQLRDLPRRIQGKPRIMG